MNAQAASGSIWIVVRGGSRDGEELEFSQDRVTIGRASEADVRFDPELDRAVSAHHAVIAWDGARWFVRDLGSRNGTFVGAARVHRDAGLDHGSTIRLGSDGPMLTVWTRAHRPAKAAGAASDAQADAEASVDAGAEGVTQRIRAEVGRETRRLRLLVLALAVTLLVVFVSSRRWSEAPPEWERERTALLQFVDSVLKAGDASGRALAGELDALAEALQTSQEQVRALRAELADTQRTDDVDADALREELRQATLALQRQQLAAAVDHERIAADGEPSVAAVWVDLGGEVLSGTAFMVGAGRLVTSGHVLTGREGNRRPTRIAVQFAGRSRVQAAEAVGVSTEHDVGVIRLLDSTDAPPPLDLNPRPDTIAEGRPAVLIGFPLGGAEPLDERSTRASPLRTVGILLETSADEALIQGYGAEGASGSPVFDERGQVLGVVQGGVADAPVQTLVAVSSRAVIELLEALGAEG